MFKFLRWLKPGASEPEREAVDPVEALTALRHLVSDAAIEDVWDAMDQVADAIELEVTHAVKGGTLGEFPLHTATLWLAYQAGNRGRTAPAWVADMLAASIVWALRFEENQVLIGGALGALEALKPSAREQLAIEVFDALGQDSGRRYWLLLKVRTSRFVEHVFDQLDAFAQAYPYVPPPDEIHEGSVVEIGPRGRMAGAFRQFGADDIDVLLAHATLENSGADFIVEAVAAAGTERARPFLEAATGDPRPRVSALARRGLDRIG